MNIDHAHCCRTVTFHSLWVVRYRHGDQSLFAFFIYSVSSIAVITNFTMLDILFRWRFVIHGGIDGYSRMIVFLRANNNNMAATVFDIFLDAVGKFGLPSRVRTDKGGENVDIARYMLNHPLRGPDRGSHITGRSVHNQRIERLWRDVFFGCTHTFYTLFSWMEDCGILDPSNEVHLLALHYVFLPRLNKQLSQFVSAHSRAPVSTEHNKSPEQLWISGLLNIWNSDHPVAEELTMVSSNMEINCI